MELFSANGWIPSRPKSSGTQFPHNFSLNGFLFNDKYDKIFLLLEMLSMRKRISTFIVWFLLALWMTFFLHGAVDCWQWRDKGVFFLIPFFIGVAFSLPTQYVRHQLRKKRESEQAKEKISETIAKFEKKQKITRRPGTYRPKNWASKWIVYSNNIPSPRKRYQMGGELPHLPRKNDE